MPELIADIAALPGCILNDRRNALRLTQRNVNGFGNPIQASLNGNLVQMTARMKIQQLQIQLFATLHFIQKSCTAFLQPFFFRMPQVYQITVMGKNVTCIQSIFPAILLK